MDVSAYETEADVVDMTVTARRAFMYDELDLVAGEVFRLRGRRNDLKLLRLDYVLPLSSRAKPAPCPEKACTRTFLPGSVAVHVRTVHGLRDSRVRDDDAALHAHLKAKAAEEQADFGIAARDPSTWNAVQDRRRELAAERQQVGPDLARQKQQARLDAEIARGRRENEEKARRVDALVASRYGLSSDEGGT